MNQASREIEIPRKYFNRGWKIRHRKWNNEIYSTKSKQRNKKQKNVRKKEKSTGLSCIKITRVC